MSIPKDLYKDYPELDWSIILGYRGSIVDGTHIPQTDPDSIDDIDLQGIVIPPVECYFGLDEFGSRGTKEIKRDEWDIVLFEYRKAVRLLMKGNPNILSLLWLKKTQYVKVTALGQFLIDRRDLFLGKHAYHSFIGYAKGQFHRMTHSACQGYMGKKRKQLVEKFGYDCKNAQHCIRILRMGIEFLTEGCLYPTRKDAVELKEIKKGEWSLEQVQKEADRLIKLADEAYVRSPLPEKPDRNKINELCVEIGEDHFDPRWEIK